ncbi:MAG: DNA primase [Gemmatimonadetes bacterium]|nr:DNA primase [Gemmatimonadota bacterium]MBT8402496.1 DNA primase [Gemmatimonadota bacterium]NNF37361.1 DNA primase [Gemmatimonadota bacterium]
MIPDDQVDEVKARADIVDVISEFVPLKKAGKEYKANCPFHEERTPSFCVVPAKGFYKCFGCGASGDVFGFLMEHVGMEFVDAVKHVAARTGVEIREVTRDRDDEDPNRPLYEANAFAESWFTQQLLDETAGVEARNYLQNRGLDPDTWERFGLGWAPDDWRGLREAAGRHGIDDDVLLTVGLLTTSEKSTEPYDRFRGRVVFPIHALGGRVVGFGGRVLGDGQPKYLNSPETPIYHKGEILYGLDRSRHPIRRQESALVVEGYMDLVSLAAAGFEHVVAPLGTALTEEQAGLLRRYTQRVLLLFDSDKAGQRATFRSADVLLAVGLRPFVVTLPPGEDPDTLVRGAGPEALQRCLDDAVDVLDRKLQILDQHDYFSTIDRRRDAVDRLLPTLRAVADPALRDIYLGQVAERTGVRRETLEAEMERADSAGRAASARTPSRSRPSEAGPGRPGRPDRRGRLAARMGPVAALLRVLAQDRERRVEHIEYILDRIGPEDFKNTAERSIFQAFVDDPELERPPGGMDAALAEALERLLAAEDDPDALGAGGRILHDSVSRLAENRLYEEMQRIQGAIEATGDDDEKRRLIREKQRVRSEAAALGIRWGPAAKKHARGFNESNGGP